MAKREQNILNNGLSFIQFLTKSGLETNSTQIIHFYGAFVSFWSLTAPSHCFNCMGKEQQKKVSHMNNKSIWIFLDEQFI